MPVRTILLVCLLSTSAPAQDAGKLPAEDRERVRAANARIVDFKKDVKAVRSNVDLVAALRKLGGILHPLILAELKPYLDAGPEVALVAIAEVGRYRKDEEAAKALIRAAQARTEPDVIRKCLAAVGDSEHRPAVPQLIPFFRHRDVDAAREAIDA